jgi:riboflavin kinase/FMN adenylyltransferase
LFSEHAVTVSSTYIRSVVAAGDVAAAAEALGRPHRVEGVVVHGDGRGRELGYPTANVAPPMYSAIPADGVYAAWFSVLGSAGRKALSKVPSAVSVGTNPTFSGRERTVEAYVLDEDVDLYGQYVAVDFIKRLRDMRAFKSRDELIQAMALDVEQTRKQLV